VQLASLDAHLQENVYLSAKAVAHWVKETFGVSYTESGMTAVLHRLGYVYKKPKLVPGKADAQAQREFLANDYKNINEKKGENDPVYFMDAVGLDHNSVHPLMPPMAAGRAAVAGAVAVVAVAAARASGR
jgi:N12 class adenine-specific DNA methylase